MSSLASIVENLQGFFLILIIGVKCLGNRLANLIPKVEQKADQSLTRVEGSLAEFVQSIKVRW
jgi:hypothetical protein